MQRGASRLAAFLAGALALVVSVDIAPNAAEFLLAMGDGEKNVRIENLFYRCVSGNYFAMVRNGKPEEEAGYDVVEAGELRVHVPRSMSFEDDIPRIVIFPRRTGRRDAGVSNAQN